MYTKKIFKKDSLIDRLEKGNSLAYCLITPGLIIIMGVLLCPILYSLMISFCEVIFSENRFQFAGVENYAKMLKDSYFLKSMGLTLYFTVLTVAFEIVLGVAMALVLNQDFYGRGFVRGIMILP